MPRGVYKRRATHPRAKTKRKSATAKDWSTSWNRKTKFKVVDEPFGVTNELVMDSLKDDKEDHQRQALVDWINKADTFEERAKRKVAMLGILYGGSADSIAKGIAERNESFRPEEFLNMAGETKSEAEPEPEANPKTLMGAQKVPVLSVIPPASILHQATAMRYGAYLAPRADGKRGYGPYNWRDQPIEAHIYIDAAIRHLMQWWDGDDEELIYDENGKVIDVVNHLGFALATIGILLDALENSTLINDRPKVKKRVATSLIAAHRIEK